MLPSPVRGTRLYSTGRKPQTPPAHADRKVGTLPYRAAQRRALLWRQAPIVARCEEVSHVAISHVAVSQICFEPADTRLSSRRGSVSPDRILDESLAGSRECRGAQSRRGHVQIARSDRMEVTAGKSRRAERSDGWRPGQGRA